MSSESVLSDVSGKSRKREAKTSSDPPKRRRACTPARRRLLAPGVMGGRTFPGELSRFIIAGYENPRVFAGVSSESGLSGKDPKFRKQFIPTQPQVAAVLAKCIPRHLSATFTDEFLRVQKMDGVSSLAVHDAIPPGSRICTTFVASIHLALLDAFGVDNVLVERCDNMNSDHDKTGVVVVPHILEIIVFDAVLARSKKIPKPLSSARAIVDAPVKMRVSDASLKQPCHDARFRALVAVLPEAGVFYCHRERRKESVGVANAHVQLDNNWLRVVRNGSCEKRFAKGGYVTRLWGGDPDCMWKWKINRRSPKLVIPDTLTSSGLHWDGSWTKSVYQLQQCADEDSPRLPPDFFDKQDHYGKWSTEELRAEYLEQYLQSKSARRNCRHYVPGYLHHHINRDQVWVIDPENEGDVDLNVSVHVRHYKGSGKVALFRDSVVQVRYLPLLGGHAVDLVGRVRDHAASILRTRGVSGVRGNRGDQGTMHPVGSRIDMNGTRKQYKASSAVSERALLEGSVRAAAQLASTSVPGVLRVIQDVEDDAALLPRHGMKGDGKFGRVSHSMDVSVDLSNATHYDVNDASQGFSIWTEDVPGSTKDWYFVLPNVFGKKTHTGPTFNGLAIKLTHGVLISWDGRVIRHGTSMMDRKGGCHVYGTFFAAKSAIVRYGVKRAIALECRRRENAEKELGTKPLLAADGAPPTLEGEAAPDDDEDVSDDENEKDPDDDVTNGGNDVLGAGDLLNPPYGLSDDEEVEDPLVGDLGLGNEDGDEDEDSSSDECDMPFDGVDESLSDTNSKMPVTTLRTSVGKSDKSVDDAQRMCEQERDGESCFQGNDGGCPPEVVGRCQEQDRHRHGEMRWRHDEMRRRQEQDRHRHGEMRWRHDEMRHRQERDRHHHDQVRWHHDHEMWRRQERDWHRHDQVRWHHDEMRRRQERDSRCQGEERWRHDEMRCHQARDRRCHLEIRHQQEVRLQGSAIRR
jgi:hypothetical protein